MSEWFSLPETSEAIKIHKEKINKGMKKNVNLSKALGEAIFSPRLLKKSLLGDKYFVFLKDLPELRMPSDVI